ncbi:MAG TPA: substrate-binding domain-containing protein [Polyangiaceae bacterium]|nr:substrate-binding domain-containing protein [Polyangiaceae bacterium]
MATAPESDVTPAAVSTARGRPNIGVFIDDLSNGYTDPILHGMSERARARDVNLVTFVGSVHPEDIGGKRHLTSDLASEHSVDGIVVITLGQTLSAAELGAYCERFRPLPMCCVPDVEADFCSRLWVDGRSGMRDAVRHMIEVHGYRDFAFMKGPARSSEAEARYEAFRETLRSFDVELDEACVVLGDYSVAGGVAAAEELFDRRGRRPRALVAANDGMAVGALKVLARLGFSVPDQVAVMGFDDIEYARYTDPPLSTVRQPLRQLGQDALEMVLSRIEGAAWVEERVLASGLVVRESCGCFGQRELAPLLDARATSGPQLSSLGPAIAREIRKLGIPGTQQTGFTERLVSAFLAEFAAPRRESFLRELRTILEAVTQLRGDPGGFQNAISILWQATQASVDVRSDAFRLADWLLHQSRIMVSVHAERAQSLRQARLGDFAAKLLGSSASLGLSVDVESLANAMAGAFPTYGIESCQVYAYGTSIPGSRDARFLSGFMGRRSMARSGEPENDDAARLLARELAEITARAEGPRRYLIGPLRRVGDSPGFALFTEGPYDGFVYENLLDQIANAVSRIQLLDHLVEEAERRETAERQRLERELALAQHIQLGILPRHVHVEGLEIASTMLTATEVGGDYYDIVPTGTGCWFCIGDVAGHGLPAGLVMLMLQSVVAGLLYDSPAAQPREVLPIVNQVLFENVRQRLRQDEYATLNLLRYDADGQLTFAGAHEDILIYRVRTGRVERLATLGTWVAATRDIREASIDTRAWLDVGDVMLLYTDGVIEARNSAGQDFGLDRLADLFESLGSVPASEIVARLREAVTTFQREQEDDLTLLAVRRLS